jgi:glyoxylase-like metal-dependent hydrolase (beta-lactamase superfamily II)
MIVVTGATGNVGREVVRERGAVPVRKALVAFLLLVLVTSSAEAATRPLDVGRYASPNPGSVNVLWLSAPAGQLHGDDYPATMTVPDHVLEPNPPVTIGGLRLATAEFGPGETHTATVFYEPSSRALFAGDIVANRMTPALLEEHSCGWLSHLDQLRKRFPHARTVYPGHGAPGAPSLIGKQERYLRDFRAFVAPVAAPSSAGGVTVTPEELATVKAKVEARYPNYPNVASLPNLMDVNITAVAHEIATGAPC